MRILSILFTLFVVTASAQDFVSSVDSVDIEDVIISATRVAENAPVTYTNVDQAQINEIYIGQDPAVLIERLVPSIVSYSDGGTDIGNYSQFRLRGIDQDRLNISLNGVPLNDMVDHGTFFSNFSDFGNSVESIQVIRGVGANSVGAASYGGSVNFESPNLFKDESNYGVQLTAGSFNTLRVSAEAQSGLIDDKFGVYARMTRTETGGFKDNSGSDSYSFFFSGGIKGDNDVLKLTAFSGRTQNGQSYLHVPLSIINENPRTNFNDLNDVDDFEQNMVQLQYAKSVAGFDYSATAYFHGAGGVFPFSFGGDQFMFGLENDQYGLQLNGTKALGQGSLSFGANGYIFDRENFDFITPLANQPFNRDVTDKNEGSVYAKYETSLDKLSFFGNAELRRLDMTVDGDETVIGEENDFLLEQDFTFFNFSLGISHELSEQDQLYVSYGETSREPTRTDLFNGVTESERVHDIELGYRHRGSKFSFEANLFHLNFDNEISQIGALVDMSYMEIRQNLPNSIRQGIEIVGSVKLTDRVDLGLNLTYMDSNIDNYVDPGTGEEFTDIEHIFAPEFLINPSVDIAITNKINFNLNARHVSQSFTELSNNEDFVLPSFTVLNSQLNAQINDNFSLSFVLNNVFDTLYFTEGSPIDVDFDGTIDDVGFRVQPPRNFYVLAKYQF